MRMWNIEPKYLCDKHLLGEHVEMHMFIGTLRKNKSTIGYINNKLVDLPSIITRHDELAQEMYNRGMKHQSPMTDEDSRILKDYIRRNTYTLYSVDVKANIIDLSNRCEKCRKRLKIEKN